MAEKPLSIDLLIRDSNVGIASAALAAGSRVAVRWNNGSAESLYPMIMLRDSCPCEKCFSPSVNSRLTLFEQLLAAACDVTHLSHQVSADFVSSSSYTSYNGDFRSSFFFFRNYENKKNTRFLSFSQLVPKTKY